LVNFSQKLTRKIFSGNKGLNTRLKALIDRTGFTEPLGIVKENCNNLLICKITGSFQSKN
jgi:hypothetical protein